MNISPPTIFPYQDLGFMLLALILATALYFLARLVIMRFLIIKGKGLGHFLSRIMLPLVFLLVGLFFKEAFPLSQKSLRYLDAGLIFFIALFLIRLVDASINLSYFRRQQPFPLPKVLHGLILAVIYLIVLFTILKDMLKVNITPFLATSAILTMILGLAFQGVLSNILSGMSLHFTKSFSRGDWVGIGPHEGIVVDTNWRETRLVDRSSNIVVLPNNIVASEKIINFSQPDNRTALTIPLKLSFLAPASDILEALLEAAGDCPDVLTLPAPQAYITSYDDFGVSYTLKFWIKDFARKHPILGEVGRLIWYKLRRRNIEISFPLSVEAESFLRAVREKPEPLLRKEKMEGRKNEKEKIFSDLISSSFLRFQEGAKAGELLIPKREVLELAAIVHRARYTSGEILFRQGEKGKSCHVVAKGLIRGEIVYEEKGKRYLSEFKVGPGGIFGEMSLFTGMPRTATGIIAQESELLEIRAEDFAFLLRRNPRLAKVIAQIVSERNQKNKEFLMKIKELSEKDITTGCNRKSILEYLKKFVLSLKR